MPLSFSNKIRALALVGFTCVCLRADFVTIPQPTASYVSSTNLLDFTDPEGEIVGGISDGIETALYNNSLTEYTVPLNWTNWAAPPAVETSVPRVGFTDGFSSLLISLTRPVTTFGFESEPDTWAQEETTASFYSGQTLVGTIDLLPNGNAGALLYAASTTTNPFTSVLIVNLADDDFAIARQRYTLASVAPEPATFLLICAGIGMAAFARRIAQG